MELGKNPPPRMNSRQAAIREIQSRSVASTCSRRRVAAGDDAVDAMLVGTADQGREAGDAGALRGSVVAPGLLLGLLAGPVGQEASRSRPKLGGQVGQHLRRRDVAGLGVEGALGGGQVAHRQFLALAADHDHGAGGGVGVVDEAFALHEPTASNGRPRRLVHMAPVAGDLAARLRGHRLVGPGPQAAHHHPDRQGVGRRRGGCRRSPARSRSTTSTSGRRSRSGAGLHGRSPSASMSQPHAGGHARSYADATSASGMAHDSP